MAKVFSPKQFRAAFRTEKQCRAYLLSLKHPAGFKCKKCAYRLYHDIAHRAAWQCGGCGYQESAKAGTVFHKSKISLVNWFQAIFELTISKGGISAVELQARLSLGSYKTAWGLLHKLRAAMAKRESGQRKVGGLIELDGAVFGRRAKGQQAHAYLAVEVVTHKSGKPGAGRLRAEVVSKLRKDDAFWFVEENVADGTTIRSDAGKDLIHIGEHLDVEVQSMTMVGRLEMNSVWLPWVHRAISNFKSALVGVYHGVSPKYLDAYLAEYCYRFNRRGLREQLQSRMLTACLASGPISMADITG